jgi:hypothetical protein
MLLFFYANSFAQSPNFKNAQVKHINENDGLLFNNIDCIMQDAKGYMWIGNNRALQRYDGVRFKTYFNGSESTNMISLAQDKKDVIWLCTHNGLYKFDKNRDKFFKYQDSVMVKGKNQLLMASNIVCDAKGNLWFSCFGYYAILYANSKEVVCADTLLNVKPNVKCYYLALQNGNKLWYNIGGDYGISYYDIVAQKSYSHYYNPNNNSLLNYKLEGGLKYAFDSTGGIWVNNSWGAEIIYWKANNLPIKQYYLKSLIPADRGSKVERIYAPASKMVVTSKNDVYLQFEEHLGIAHYNNITDDFDYLYPNSNSDYGLWDNISIGYGNGEMYLDKDDNIWYPGRGINVLNPYKQIFGNIIGNGYNDWFSKSQKNFQGTDLVNIIKLQNSGYIASFNGDGIWKLDNDFKLVNKLKINIKDNSDYGYIFSNNDKYLFIENNNNLYKHNLLTNSTIEIKKTNNTPFKIRNVYYATETSIWYINGSNEIGNINTTTNISAVYKVKEAKNNTAINGFISILPASEGKLWITASYVGLHLFDTLTKAITNSYYLNPNNLNDYPSNVFGQLTKLNNDTLIITGNALIFFDVNTKKFTKYKIVDGLPSDRISSTVVDKFNKNIIWVNTYDKGVFIFNIKTKTATSISVTAGNTMFRGQHYSYLDTTNGNILFSNINGFAVLNRQNFDNNIRQDTVSITEILINNQSFNVDSILSLKKLDLKHTQNNIVIKLSDFNYWPFTNKTYFFRLSNKDPWQKVDDNGIVSFLKLPPGNYKFEFAVAENEQAITNASAFLNLSIVPAFYNSTWFLILCILALVGIVYAWYRRRLKIVRDKAALKEKIAETEMAALKAQMNPHFIFNSLNSIENFIMKNEKRLASDYLNKFAQLIRSILDSSLNELVPLYKDLQTLQWYVELEQLRFNNNFTYQAILSDELKYGDYKIPSLIIQPYLENAIIHGLSHSHKSNLFLKLEVQLLNNNLVFTITDNGIGISQAKKINSHNKPNHKSVGLDITQSRINLFNKNNLNQTQVTEWLLMDGSVGGTKVVVTLNIN